MNEKRNLISSGSPYEKPIGFSRAVRVGNTIAVSGTAPITPDGTPAFPGDVYKQTLRCLEIMKEAIESAGGKLEQVIRTRIFITDIALWEEAGRAHGEFFSEIRPAATCVEVSRLIEPEWLVEIEADCIVE